ncbi:MULTISPECIES: Z1 domain-containing protein [Rhodococcus]|uniref:Z1 domain-containing protein n=1 Tax=Rhodococcus TaxID=1827 RepID=UPI000C9AC106|nr:MULTISPECIES: Z1 domain-containing protein [Rhodococcus]PND52138.1 endonuclease [Rhodococcus sp. ENV425]USC17304.1 Z1 domain-containing protein [Rhodococcus sp. 11-3]WKX00605.1 Z1 domain-containing protein [Rhodococcus aetherivorans]
MTIPVNAYLAALGAMQDRPKDLLKRAEMEASDYGGGEVSHDSLLAHLQQASPNDPLRQNFGLRLARWDAVIDPDWSDQLPGTIDRRRGIYESLGVTEAVSEWLTMHYPPHEEGTIVISSDEWDPWYISERRHGRFYWDAYERHLLEVKKWPALAVQDLDNASDQILERLADPTRKEAFQSKGLVVGYVQSGKTANFTGVVAKAIDAGYRYIIVLTGMIDLLRDQTQRRLDMELVGVENLLGDGTLDEVSSDPKFDYGLDEDWPYKFMRLGVDPDTAQQPSITRYTGQAGDYKGLGGAADQLKPVKIQPDLPLYAPENLTRARAGLFVIKKNARVIDKLVADLKRVRNSIKDIPVLIIDDESDQASVNTVNPEKVAKAKQEGKEVAKRTAINRGIGELLGLMPRAQYVGYTATPFANVFIDPDDAQDLFPKDFVVGLKRPFGYMGAADFSDVDKDFDPTTTQLDPAESNRAAFIRDLRADDQEARFQELKDALDMFVLTGAVKLFRAHKNSQLSFRHHTMLVHQSVYMAVQKDVMQDVQTLWGESGYTTPRGLNRLRKLYDKDLAPVSAARIEAGVPAVPSFDALKPYIGQAVARIAEHAGNPVIVVNGDTDLQANQQQLDFDKGSVWRVLVGGTKLSRGFTVEGLTVTYFRRVTRLHDTLTQAGRWFGFRYGYRDLVRVFIGRSEKFGTKRVDLLEAFDAVVQDEEEFRTQLRSYSQLVNGRPQMRPIDIPPLVSQHLFWLKPTATNKMFNAVLEQQHDPEFGLDGHPIDRTALETNLSLWEEVLNELGPPRQLLQTEPLTNTFEARCGIASYARVLALLRNHIWLENYRERVVDPRLRFLESLQDKIEDFAVISPQPGGIAKEDFGTIGEFAVVSRRRRTERGNLMGEPTDPKHRGPAIRIATGHAHTDPRLSDLAGARRGALLVYAVKDTTEGADPTRMFGFRVFLPSSVIPPGQAVVRFRAKQASKQAIVDNTDHV